MIKYILFALITIIFLPDKHCYAAITVMQNGTAEMEIVIPLSPSQGEIDAANDLVEWLAKVSSVHFVIVQEGMQSKNPIYVGNCSSAQFLNEFIENQGNDGFVINITDFSIYLLGKSEIGTRFAVAEFLENYIGIRWYYPEIFGDELPDNMGTYIPHKSTITLLPGRVIQEPDFQYRSIGAKDHFDSETAKWLAEFDDSWRLRRKINLSIRDLAYSNTMNREFHTFNDFIDPKQYYMFPEWFAQVWGERLTPEELQESDQRKLNLSNLELRQTLVSNIVQYIDEHPNIDIINLTPSDGTGWDESPETLSLDGENLAGLGPYDVRNKKWSALEIRGELERHRVLSARYTRFYQIILEAVTEQRPNVLLMPGAYSAFQSPPLENFEMLFGSNVMLLLTHSWEHNHPIENRASRENICFNDALNGWKELYQRMGIYEYYYKWAMLELPFPILHTIRKDIPYYKQKGIEYFYTQANSSNVGSYGPLYYLTAN